MGEIGHTADAVNKGESQGDQRQPDAIYEAVDQDFEKDFHNSASGHV